MSRSPFYSVVALLVIAFACLPLARSQDAGPAPAPQAAAPRPTSDAERRVLIVSIDGLRPDLMLRADAPQLRALLERGSFTCWAQTTPMAITLPSHTSMLTGAGPLRHGIEWNRDLPFADPVYPRVPTIFDLARSAGMRAAMATGKSKFSALARPESLEAVYYPTPQEEYVEDAVVAERAATMIEQHRPHVLFVHLAMVDMTGHRHGWGSPEQMAAIGRADAAVGRLLAALESRGLGERTLVLISADHGGAGLSHGPDDARSRHIPWIAAGPGVRAGYDLTRHVDLVVRVEDTFATACAFLGFEPQPGLEGQVVTQIYEAE